MIRSKIVFFLLLFVVNFLGCRNQENHNRTVDFAEKDTTNTNINFATSKSLKVAVSAMISPKETFISYQALIDYLSNKINKKIELVQRKTYQEVNNLLESGELDFAFICSGAYVELSSKCQTDIIAVPQSNGKSLYQAYLISNKNTNIQRFGDFKGRSFAYTDPLSNTGRLYILKKLNDSGVSEKEYFSNFIYSNAHDNSIQLVNRGLIDGASVDGLIFEYIRKKTPERVNNIYIIEKSEFFGIPPIVSRLDKKIQLEALRDVLFGMHEDNVGRKILLDLQIDKFIPGYDSTYNSIRKVNNMIKK